MEYNTDIKLKSSEQSTNMMPTWKTARK